MKHVRHIVFLLILCTSTGIFAQSLRGLTENRVIKKRLADQPFTMKSVLAEPVLTLPFFDDFSTSSVFPDPDKWADHYAFINTSFAKDPVSIGVATLDAIDEKGDVYALNDWPTSSDMLTSHAFDLSSYSLPGDTIRLSFFYQPGGKGEVPEITDSLLLEFYSPAKDRWWLAWYSVADTASPFQQVIITVPGSYYLNGFRFRFRNYTSISAEDVTGGKGAVSNADCWHIDYIMMNTSPALSHELIRDIALIEPPRNLIDFYESVPWLHLNQAQSLTRNYMQYVFRNLEKGPIENLGRSYYTRNLKTGYTEYAEQFFDVFNAEDIYRVNDPFMAPFTRNDDSDEGNIEVGGFLITPETQFKPNDTAKIILRFKDYYAYDDGTPEYGFGISGPSTAGALLACRFRIFQPDTLRAIDMLFNKARDNYNAKLKFHLCVWNDDGGKPGELIYLSAEEFTPELGTGMTEFKRYPLDPDANLVITDTVVYVGWKQVSDEFLNLGYDVNRDNVERIFVNMSGQWNNPGNSIIPGSPMIRAVFGSKDVITGATEVTGSPDEIVLFPNPVSEILSVKTSGLTIMHISLYDISGRLIMQLTGNPGQVDVSDLLSGVYQMIFLTGTGQNISRKIVVGP